MAIGVIGVGFIFIAMDHLAVKISGKINPPGSLSLIDNQEQTFATEDERRRHQMRKANFMAIQSRKMRRDGIIVICLGVVALLIILLTTPVNPPSSQDTTLKIANALTKKTKVPWGQISMPVAIGFSLLGVFFFRVGIQRLKHQSGLFRTCFCFVLGLMILLEGIFQWQ